MTYEAAAVLASLAAQLRTAILQNQSAIECLERGDQQRAELYLNASIATSKNVEHALAGHVMPRNVRRIREPRQYEPGSDAGIAEWMLTTHDSETKR